MAGLRDVGERLGLGAILGDKTSIGPVGAPRSIHLFTVDVAGEVDVIAATPSVFPGEVPSSTPSGYRPQLVEPNGFGYIGTNPSRVQNSAQFIFSPMPACTVVAWGLSTLGGGTYTLLLTGLFATPIPVALGQAFVIPAGALVVTMD